MKKTMKIMTWVLMTAFLVQDVAWAALRESQSVSSQSTLQIPTVFQYLRRGKVEFALGVKLKQVIGAMPQILEEERIPHLLMDVEGMKVEILPGKQRKEGSDLIINCGVSTDRSYRRYEAVISLDKSIKLRPATKPSKNIPSADFEKNNLEELKSFLNTLLRRVEYFEKAWVALKKFDTKRRETAYERLLYRIKKMKTFVDTVHNLKSLNEKQTIDLLHSFKNFLNVLSMIEQEKDKMLQDIDKGGESKRIGLVTKSISEAKEMIAVTSETYSNSEIEPLSGSAVDIDKVENLVRGLGLQTCLANSVMLIYILRYLGEEAELGGMFRKKEDLPFHYVVFTKNWGERDITPYDDECDDYDNAKKVDGDAYERCLSDLKDNGYIARADREIANTDFNISSSPSYTGMVAEREAVSSAVLKMEEFHGLSGYHLDMLTVNAESSKNLPFSVDLEFSNEKGRRYKFNPMGLGEVARKLRKDVKVIIYVHSAILNQEVLQLIADHIAYVMANYYEVGRKTPQKLIKDLLNRKEKFDRQLRRLGLDLREHDPFDKKYDKNNGGMSDSEARHIYPAGSPLAVFIVLLNEDRPLSIGQICSMLNRKHSLIIQDVSILSKHFGLIEKDAAGFYSLTEEARAHANRIISQLARMQDEYGYRPRISEIQSTKSAIKYILENPEDLTDDLAEVLTDNNYTFAQTVKFLRKREGWDRRTMSQYTEIGKSTVENIESYSKYGAICLIVIPRLATTLGIEKRLLSNTRNGHSNAHKETLGVNRSLLGKDFLDVTADDEDLMREIMRLANLKGLSKSVINLIYFEGKVPKEVQKILNLKSRQHVDDIRKKALKKLRWAASVVLRNGDIGPIPAIDRTLIPYQPTLLKSQSAHFLREIVDCEKLTQNIIEGVLSTLFSNKKLTLAFSKNLKGLESAQLRILIKELELWKEAASKKNPSMKKLLRGFTILEYTDLNKALSKKGIDPADAGNLIFVYEPKPESGYDNRVIAPTIKQVYIQEPQKGFPENYYYPLLEMVTISLSRELSQWDSAQLRQALEVSDISIDTLGISTALNEELGILVFRVLPKMERYNNDYRIDRYTRLLQFLHSA